MKLLRRLPLAIVIGVMAFISPALAQQPSPSNILPPTPQKPPTSPALSAVTPSGVQTLSANPISTTPQTTSASLPSQPAISQPTLTAGTNAAQAANPDQPLAANAHQPSPWDKSGVAPASAWEQPGITTNALAPVVKPSPDPWKSTSPTRNWDTTPPLGSAGAKTDWK